MKKPLIWLLLFLCLSQVVLAQQTVQAPPAKTRLLFVLDASGSMLAPWERGTRMDVAKKLLANLVDSLQHNDQLELGLRVYGHTSPRQKNDCQDSKLEVGFSAGNHQDIIQTLQTLQPQGNTPLAYSLEQAANDFPVSNQYRNILILITDGLESCGGDPCAVSLALQKKRVFLKPFVIALSQEAGMTQQFNCMGNYYDASNLTRFRAALNDALRQSLGKTTLTIELLNAENQAPITDLNIAFVNQATGETMYNYMHYRDSKGKTDTLQVDPVPAYQLVLGTLPPMVKSNVQLKGGRHNTVTLPIAAGTLALQQANHKEYTGGVRAAIRKAGHTETLYLQGMNSNQTFLSGYYDVEVFTLPRLHFDNVKLENGKTTTINLPAPGVLNIRSDVASWRDLYLINEDGQQELILQLDNKNSINSLALQPGNYRIVYRAKNAQGSKFTQVKDFTITSGKTVTLNLFGR